MPLTESSRKALLHLKAIRPYDGWTIEMHGTTKEIRVVRRGIPLTDNYFNDIHYDAISDSVVGILVKGPPTKAQVLVDEHGKPIGRTPAIIHVTTWNPNAPYSRNNQKSRASNQAGVSTTSSATPTATGGVQSQFSQEQNQLLLKYAGFAIAFAVAVKALMNAVFALYIILLPILYLYALSTAPHEDSFDAKKELKRVMRGHHLPEDHPDKPKGWFSETLSRMQAAVTTELATGLGYQITMTSLGGAAIVTRVDVPSVNQCFYWVGVFNKWRYLFCMELDPRAESPGVAATAY
eukprot:CAMPEP_0202442804 /NCGR_PEP_ID=MMETSP1360-20130828/2165_1 /ASSEMBLY_ACC=CAM_ASM_000848 /TAXON_ID=515479 /ORGANISM="Licmophora paradoxa, Strain CCMP2313" /LENGTH=292 /DNA_ID=CAMNT_0049058261 /DNA_START=28 /DNA_END=906 /DNA_ORIENTATION=-